MPPLPIPPHLAELVVRQSRVAIAITDADRRIIYVNPAFTRVTGYPPNRVLGRNPRVLKSGVHDADFYLAMWKSIDETGTWEGEITNRRRDGSLYSAWLAIVAMCDDHGAVTHYFSMFNDISERKRYEERQAHLAMYDALTELPNRFLFDEHLRTALQMAYRRNGTLAVLFLDLDGFKSINDDFGHAEGDEVLRVIAGRLRHTLRASDVVARRSGDEFTICLLEPQHPVDPLRIATKLRQAVRLPLHTPEGSRFLDVSIGIACYPVDGRSDQELLQLADARMYARKRHLARRRRRMLGEAESSRTPSASHEAIHDAIHEELQLSKGVLDAG